jgi:TP901 family phage tail tape measure protein
MAIAEVVARFVADTSQMTAAMKKAESQIQSTAHHMQTAGSNMGLVFTAAGAAIAAGLGFAVKKSMDFEAQIDRVGAIAGATGSDMGRLKQAALDLGASTSKSATEVAQGMELMAASGFNTNQIIKAMPGVIAAAEASGEDMARVTEVVTAALNGFGLEASKATHVADVMAMAANRSNASVDDLGYAFKYAAPAAHALGISMEELAAATGIMTDAGMKGEQAGTTLRMAFQRMASPTAKAKELMKQLGLSFFDANGKMKPLGEIIGQLSTKLKGMSDQQKIAALNTLFGTEASTGMLAVIQKGPDKFNKFTEALRNSGGAAKDTAAKMKDNLKGSLEQLQGAFETAQITIGDRLAPAIRAIADGITKLINAFNSLSPTAQNLIIYGSAIAAILFIVAGAIFGAIAAVGFIIEGMAAFAAVIGVTTGALATTVGWILAIIAAVVALGVGIYYLATNWGTVWNTIKTTAIAVWNAIASFFASAWAAIVSIWNSIWNGVKSVWNSVWTAVKSFSLSIWNGIKTFLTGIWNGIKSVATSVWNGIKNFVVGAFKWMYNHNYYFKDLVDFIVKAWNKAKAMTSSVWNAVKSFLVGLWNGIKSRAISVWNGLKSALSSAWNAIKSVTSSVWNSIRSFLSGVWNGIKSRVVSVWNSIRSATSSAWSSIRSTISNVASGIRSALSSLASKALSWGRNMMNMFLSGIRSRVSAIVGAVKGVAGKIAGFLGFHSPTKYGPASDSDKWMPNMMNMFADGIKKKMPMLARMTKGVAGQLATINGMSVSPAVRPSVSGLAVSSAGFASRDEVAATSSGVVITGNTFHVRKDSDIREIARELDRLAMQRMRAKGKVRW